MWLSATVWQERGRTVVNDRRLVEGAHPPVGVAVELAAVRGVRKSDLMEPFPRLTACYERCNARPAWQRTLALYAERVGACVDDIR